MNRRKFISLLALTPALPLLARLPWAGWEAAYKPEVSNSRRINPAWETAPYAIGFITPYGFVYPEEQERGEWTEETGWKTTPKWLNPGSKNS